MANVSRFSHADARRIVAAPVDTGTVIEVGDFLYLDTNDVKNAASLTYITSPTSAALDLAATQAEFAAKAYGIAVGASATGQTADIAVSQAGIYQYPCASSTWELGDLVGLDDDATPLLTDQQVINVTATAGVGNTVVGAIGRCVKQESSAVTTVLFELMLPYQIVQTPQLWTMFSGLHTSAADLVTDWVVPIPFTLLEIRTTVLVLTSGAGVISVENGTTALDDTVTVADAAAIGVQDSVATIDATGDHIFNMGDILTITSDGTPTAGELLIQLLVQPYMTNAI